MTYDDAARQNGQRQTRDGGQGEQRTFQRGDDRRGRDRRDGWRRYDDRGREAGGYQPRRYDDRRGGYGYDRRDRWDGGRYRYEVLEHVATLRESERYGNRLDLNVMAWNGGPEKIDLRTWRVDDYGDWHPAGGVTLSYDEVDVVMDTLTRFLATPRGEWRPDQPRTPESERQAPADGAATSSVAAPDGAVDDGVPF